MKRIKRIVATVGKYTDREGKEKNQYQNIGTLFQRDDGTQCIKIEAVPVGWTGWANFYEIDEKKETAPAQTQATALNDEIPF